MAHSEYGVLPHAASASYDDVADVRSSGRDDYELTSAALSL